MAAATGHGTRPNAPLRLPRPFDSGASLPRTRSALEREREAFFETRVSGRAESWQAIRLAAELVRDNGDLITAQGVLDAAGLTVPRGRLEEGIWDELGQLYRIESWIVADPRDIIEDITDEEDINHKEPISMSIEGDTALVSAVTSKSKVRVRLSDRGTDVLVVIGKDQSVGFLKELIRERAKVRS